MLQTDLGAAAAAAGAKRLGSAFIESYARLPVHFFTRVDPTRVADPTLIAFNSALASELGLDVQGLDARALAEIFSGNRAVPGTLPIAMVYAGHQFGQFVSQLGDGRAILLGEVRDRFGRRRDIQLKGSGRTPYSRSGDGRAALGPVLREYVVSGASHALGIPAPPALAAVASGEAVYRERGALPGAVLTRVAASHVRVGTFQYFAARGDMDAIRRLADYVIERHYPDARSATNPYLQLLRSVMQRQARLVAGWMNVGFIHGVMNTDNMAISGETIDFGPCAFMDAYDPATVFSAIDQFGRYAYANQPRIARWNLARFAETLLPLIDTDQDRSVERASDMISGFSARFERYWLAGMREKLGLRGAEDGDAALIGILLETMHKNAADFTLTFRRLCDAALSPENDAGLQALFAEPGAFNAWAGTWRLRLDREPHDPQARADAMRRVNPVFIPRNHRVEHALAMAVEQSDFGAFDELLEVLSRPYEEQPAMASYADAPAPSERVFRTYCGT